MTKRAVTLRSIQKRLLGILSFVVGKVRWSSIGWAFVVMWLTCGSAMPDDWPQWRGPTRDGRWHETGLIQEFASDQLPYKWQADIGPGYSGPTVARGRVYVTDRQLEPTEIERVHCLDAETGATIWTHSYPCIYGNIGYTAGPRASVTVDAGRAYALGATGKLHCFNAATGEVQWYSDLKDRFRIRMPMWGIAAAPLIVEDLVILHIGGRNGACLVALDAATGKERWRALDERASYSTPILIRQANESVLAAWTGDSFSGLDPTSGEVHWRIPFPPTRMPIGTATPVMENGHLFVSSFYDGSLMVRFDEQQRSARKLWAARGRNERRTEALHCMISTPVFIDGYLYGVDSYGELRCLDAGTGERIWEDQTATPRARWSNIHLVQQADRIWMFNERGELLIAKLSPEGFQEISRTQLIDPTTTQLPQRDGVCWSHPAFANRHVFARNDKQLVCASLAE